MHFGDFKQFQSHPKLMECLKCEWRQSFIVFQHKCYNEFILFSIWWLVPISYKWNEGENKEMGHAFSSTSAGLLLSRWLLGAQFNEIQGEKK